MNPQEGLIQFAEYCSDHFWSVDQHLHLTYANRSFKEWLQSRTGKMVQPGERFPFDLLDQLLEGNWPAYYERALAGEAFDVQVRFRANGQLPAATLQLIFRPIVVDGAVTGAACMAQENSGTEQLRTELKKILDISLDVLCTLNKEGCFVTVGSAALQHWGYSPEALAGSSFTRLVYPEDLEKTTDILAALLQGQEVRAFENRYLRKDGRIAYNLWSMRWDEASGLIYGVARNAFDALQKDAMMRLSELRFKALVQEGDDLIGILNKHYEYSNVSPTSTTILGIDPEDFIGKKLFTYIHPEDKAKVMASLEQLATVPKVEVSPFRFLNSKGEWRWLETVLTNMLNNAAVRGIVVNSRDITERMEEEQRLRLLEKVIAQTQEAILITEASPLDAPGPAIVYVNEAFCKLTGYDREELIGKSPVMLQGPKSNHAGFRELSKTLRAGGTGELTTINYKKTGEPFWVNFQVSPVLDEKGEVQLFISIERDVTQQQRNEAEKTLQAKISQIFSREKALDAALDRLCEEIAGFMECDIAEVWIPLKHKSRFQPAAVYAATAAGRKFYALTGKPVAIGLEEGIAGAVWTAGALVQWTGVSAAAQEAGLDTMTGLPLRHQDQVVGVLVTGCRGKQEQLEQQLPTLGKLETFIGSELSRKKLEQEFEQLFQVIPKLIVTLDEEGVIMRINPAGCDLLAGTSEQLVGQSIETYVHPQDLDIFREAFRNLDPDGGNSGFSCRIISRTRETLWLHWSWNYQQHAGIIFASARNFTAEKKLTELLEDATSLALIGSWELNLKGQDGDTMYWSPMLKKILEVEEHYDASLSGGFEFYVGEHRVKIQSAVQRIIAEGGRFDEELLIRTGKGRYKWVRCIGEAEFVHGVCSRVFGSYQDIDDRKRTEEELLRAYEEKNRIVESISDAFFTMNEDFTVTYWNRSAEKLIGVKREDLVGRNLWEVFPDAMQLPSYKNTHLVLETGQPITFEEFYGTWLEVNVNRSDEGLTVFFKDITLRKEADLRLLEANERFEKVAEATNEAIWDWNIQANRMYWGTGFSKLFGYSDLHQADIQTWEMRIAEEDRARVVSSITATIEDRSRQIWEEEYRYRKADGNFAEVMDRGLVIRDRNGNPLRMVGAIRDLTYRKEYQRELQRLNDELKANMEKLQAANRELEQFAFVASHDLQEPLRMVASFMDQLKRKYSERLDEKANQYIFYAADGARRMKTIISDLLEFSRAGRYFEPAEGVALVEILEDYTVLRRKIMEEKSVRLRFASLPVVHVQKVPLVQTMHCLLDNAIKYSRIDVPPVISVEVKEEVQEWIIAIKDNGIGIDSRFYDKIFVIFQRLHNRDVYEGTGIGLSLVKKHVESWGGRVWLESQPGAGSTFYFSIRKNNQ